MQSQPDLHRVKVIHMQSQPDLYNHAQFQSGSMLQILNYHPEIKLMALPYDIENRVKVIHM